MLAYIPYMDPMGVLLSCIHQHLLRRAKTIWTYLDLKHQTHKKWIWPRPPQPTKCNKNTVVLNSKEMKRMRCKSSHEKTTNKSGFWYGSGYSLRPLKSTKKTGCTPENSAHVTAPGPSSIWFCLGWFFVGRK